VFALRGGRQEKAGVHLLQVAITQLRGGGHTAVDALQAVTRASRISAWAAE
jgi:hypothetical protein